MPKEPAAISLDMIEFFTFKIPPGKTGEHHGHIIDVGAIQVCQIRLDFVIAEIVSPAVVNISAYGPGADDIGAAIGLLPISGIGAPIIINTQFYGGAVFGRCVRGQPADEFEGLRSRARSRIPLKLPVASPMKRCTKTPSIP
jgi:hypothetical protein